MIQDPANKKRLICKVNVYGISLGNVRYELEAVEIETIPPLGLEPKYVSDKESASKARDGHVVMSYRVEYVDGVWTSRKELYKDTYQPKPEKIYDPELAKD